MINPSFWKNKRVFITGHTGFKGGWLALWLKKMGVQVKGYALAPSTPLNLFEMAQVASGMQSVFGDLRDPEKLCKEMKEFNPDIVIHMAAQALVRPSYRDPVGTYATNVMGTIHLFEACRKASNLKVIVNVTSDKCYENKELQRGYAENDSMGGHDPYSNSKGCVELISSAYRRSFFEPEGKAALATVRAGNVIGGGDWAEDRLIPDCIRNLVNQEFIAIRNPSSIRPWQHVLDPLHGYLLLVEQLWENPKKYSRGWNFGPSVEQAKQVDWVVDRLTQLWGNGARWQLVKQDKTLHEAVYLKLDCTLAHEQLGWKPMLNIQQALEYTVDWYSSVLREKKSALDLSNLQIEKFEKLVDIK